MLPLSARSQASLTRLTHAYQSLNPQLSTLNQTAAAAAHRRPHHEVRRAHVVTALDQLDDAPGRTVTAKPRVVFVCPGQGSQWVGMGRQLLEQEEVFRKALEPLDAATRPYLQGSLLDLLNGQELTDIDLIQPALFAMSVGLAALWRHWGVEPDAVVGTSMGEVAACHLAGILSLEDAARIICVRSRLMARLRGKGAMGLLPLTLEAARKAIAALPEVAVAASNSPNFTVISGEARAVAELVESVEGARLVKVDVASHSPQVDELKDELLAELAGVAPLPATLRFVSTVDESTHFGPDYWWKNLREPVLLAPTVARLLDSETPTVFLELSPHPILWDPLLDCLHTEGRPGIVVPSLRRDGDSRVNILEAAAQLYESGLELNWPGGHAHADLPLYPWNRQTGGAAVEAAPPQDVRQHVEHEALRVLGAQELEWGRTWQDLGLTSLMAVELRGRLERVLNRSFPATLLFNYPTPQHLAEHLTSENPALTRLVEESADPIAIVGMACRFPGGVNTPDDYWNLLLAGVDAVTEVPPERWPADPDDPATRWGGFLTDIDRFEPEFFNIACAEARSMDPQQRLLLEVSWEALERAGIVAPTHTGVFVGIWSHDYESRARHEVDPYAGTGNFASVAAGRIAYCLGLEGPTLAVDTACSSSLVAVHLAAEALRHGECDLALAGGVNLILDRLLSDYLARIQALSPTGRCHTFGARADGYVRGEGCGVMVLKRLSDARRDGDRILAVLRATAVNQDGRSNGLTAPNGASQENLLRTALARAGLRPTDLGYVECHGTGTPLGDPIEVHAIAAVLGDGRDEDNPLLLGSSKSNLGHLESAAGIAGLMKAVLCVQHGELPPSLHSQPPNPYLNWDALPVRVVRLRTPLRGRVGVNSFGISGTNAHAIVEPAPASPPQVADERPAHLLVLSARSRAALRQLRENFREHRDADACHTAALGRTHFEHRLAWVSGSEPIEGRAAAQPPRIAFLFTGQGSQYPGMAKALYDAHPVFRAALDRCAALLDFPLLEVLYGADSPVDRTEYTQPALFAVEWALSELWQSWGILPEAVIGHSLGEIVAATVAGVFTLEDALRLVSARARLMGELPAGGAMVSLRVTPERAREAIAPYATTVSLAALNGPQSVVISGVEADVLAAAEGLEGKRLTVSHAFHSPLVEPMLEAFREVCAGLQMAPPRLALYSNLTGARVESTGPDYWVQHVRQPVLFAQGVASLDVDVCLEVGPHPVLTALVPDALPSLRRDRDDWKMLLTTLGELYVKGAVVDWKAFEAPWAGRRVELPTYPFQRESYWIDQELVVAPRLDETAERRDPAELGRLIQAEAAGVFGVDVPLDANFTDYGMTSLMAIELRGRLVRAVGRELPYTVAFLHPSVAAMVEFLTVEAAPAAVVVHEPPLGPLAASQYIFWYLATVGIHDLLGCRFRITGLKSKDALLEAVSRVLEGEDIFWTAVNPNAPVLGRTSKTRRLDLRVLYRDQSDEALRAEFVAFKYAPYAETPLARAAVCFLADGAAELWFGIPHVIGDYSSLVILVQRVLATIAGQTVTAPSFYHGVSRDVSRQYTDEAVTWWNDYLPRYPTVRIPAPWYEAPPTAWRADSFTPMSGPTPHLEALLAAHTRDFTPLVEAASAYAFARLTGCRTVPLLSTVNRRSTAEEFLLVGQMADFDVLLLPVPRLDPHAFLEVLRAEKERTAPWQTAPVMVKLGTWPGRDWHAHRQCHPYLPPLAPSATPPTAPHVVLMSNVILTAVPHVPPALSGVRVEGPFMADMFVNPLNSEIYAMLSRDDAMRPTLYLGGLLNEAGRAKFTEDFTAALQAFLEA